MNGRIVTCRECGRKFKTPGMIWMVFPPGYDHSCCSECNAEVADVPCFQPVGPRWSKRWMDQDYKQTTNKHRGI